MRALAALALAAALSGTARAQFGQNHVVVRDFDWRVRSTEHFDVYYYKETENLAPRAAEILEQAFTDVTKRLNIHTDPPIWATPGQAKRQRWERRPFFLYASPNDFEQSNIAIVGDGTGGITEPLKNRFMVYNDGSRRWLEDVITHEFTHVMQFYVLISGWWRSGEILKSIVYPLWMMEGMADYSTREIDDTFHEVTVRDAATSGGLIPLFKLEHFGHLKPHQIVLAYEEGSAAMGFLADQYGPRKVGDMLRLFQNRVETGQVLKALLGIDEMQLDRRFREFEEEHYARQVRVERMREPDAFGASLTRTPDDIPQFNAAPVFSPDLATMYYMSTAHGYPPELRELDVKTGRSRRIAPVPWSRIENLPLGNFANMSRALDISSDGRYLLFVGTRNHEDALFLYDTRSRKLSRKAVPGFEMVMQPHFSPDGSLIVFSGMKRSRTDLWLYHMDDGRVEQLTDDARDDAMPVFTPDGRSIVFSGERLDELDPRGRERRLYRLDLADRRETLLEETGVQARDPLVSPDGKRVLFVRDGEGASEICELDLETGRAARLTRLIGGAFTPMYAGDRIAFAALRRGSVHIHLGARSDFLDEELPQLPRRAPGEREFVLPGMGGVRPSTTTVAFGPERPYRFSYSTDLFIPAFYYSSPGGMFLETYWQGSDLLGNHTTQAMLLLHNQRSFEYEAAHAYTRYRPQLFASASGIGREDLIDSDTGHEIDDAYHQQTAGVAFPFDRYHRAEALLGSATERIHDRTDGSENDDREARLGQVALVRDTARGRYLLVTQGDRARATYTNTVQALGGNRIYRTATFEGQKFFQTGSQATLALRGFGGQTLGRDHPQFILGGLGGVRGYGYSTTENAGRSMALVNAEWRFPIAPDLNYYMWYFFPDFYFKALFGTLFTDAGYAWDSKDQLQDARWRDLRNSVGLGLRLYTFILQEFPLVVSFDYAHRTTQNGGIFYVYLGQYF